MPACRCSNCRRRKTLRLRPEKYIRAPKCDVCGDRRWSIDSWRMKHETGRGAPKPCNCGWYAFPHRRGSGVCLHNPSVTEEHVNQLLQGSRYEPAPF